MAKINILKESPDVNGVSENVSSPMIQQMSSVLQSICIELTVPSNTFNPKKVFSEVKDYVKHYERLLYANISSFCFNLENDQRHNFQGNMEKLVEYVFSWDFENGLRTEKAQNNIEEVELRKNTRKVVLKIYDHISLAATQLSSLKQSEEELQRVAFKKLQPFKDEITKDMSSQLITLVGIFTAIAFLVFGGFSALTSTLENFSSNPISKIVFLVSLWELVVCNGVFIFLTSIEKIILKEKKINFYTVFQWTNLILITVAALSIWTYFVDKKNIGTWFVNLLIKEPTIIAAGGFITIFIIFIAGIILINLEKIKSVVKNRGKSKK